MPWVTRWANNVHPYPSSDLLALASLIFQILHRNNQVNVSWPSCLHAQCYQGIIYLGVFDWNKSGRSYPALYVFFMRTQCALMTTEKKRHPNNTDLSLDNKFEKLFLIHAPYKLTRTPICKKIFTYYRG